MCKTYVDPFITIYNGIIYNNHEPTGEMSHYSFVVYYISASYIVTVIEQKNQDQTVSIKTFYRYNVASNSGLLQSKIVTSKPLYARFPAWCARCQSTVKIKSVGDFFPKSYKGWSNHSCLPLDLSRMKLYPGQSWVIGPMELLRPDLHVNVWWNI